MDEFIDRLIYGKEPLYESDDSDEPEATCNVTNAGSEASYAINSYVVLPFSASLHNYSSGALPRPGSILFMCLLLPILSWFSMVNPSPKRILEPNGWPNCHY